VAPEPVTAEPEQEKQNDIGNDLDYEISLLELTLEIVDDLKTIHQIKTELRLLELTQEII
jgi:hypothetical protein